MPVKGSPPKLNPPFRGLRGLRSALPETVTLLWVASPVPLLPPVTSPFTRPPLMTTLLWVASPALLPPVTLLTVPPLMTTLLWVASPPLYPP